MAIVIFTVVTAIIMSDSPFTPTQILWVNVMIDSLAALALATDRPHEGSLQSEKCPEKDENILNPSVIRNIILNALY